MSADHATTGFPAAPARPAPTDALERAGMGLATLGVLASVVAVADGGLDRLAPGYLLGFVFCWSVVLGSLFFVALQHVTGSVWSLGFRRVAEALSAPVGLLVVLFLPLVWLTVGRPDGSLFPWLDDAVVHGDHLLEGKAAYLNPTAFLIRMGAFFLVWLVSSRFFVGQSLRQDRGVDGVGITQRLRRGAPPFLILFAFTVTFASFDWLMSLQPLWFSTIFGVYAFSGMTLAALAAITIGVLGLRAAGRLPSDLARKDHVYSLGALLFAFTCWWGYIAFSQFMLVWYGNIPEETVWFVRRMRDGWGGVTALLAVVRFVVPFLLLLPRSAKTDPTRLAIASALVLVGQALDLFWLILPPARPGAAGVGVGDFGPLFLLAGVLALYVSSWARRHPTVPVGDPRLDACRRFHL